MSINPLGRGLESLIPKNQQKKDDAGQVNPPEPALLYSSQQADELDLPAGPAEEAAKVFTSIPTKPFSIWEEEEEEAKPVPPPEMKSADEKREELEMPPVFAEVFKPELKPEPKFEPKPEPRHEEASVHAEFKPKLESKKEKEPKKTGEAIYYVEVSKVHPNPDQPRKIFNEEALRELASSIREFGVLQPIVVSKIEKETESGTEVEYELIAGERRLMASKLLGLETIPAIIRNMKLERERLELAIIENLQRENLNPVEMARAYSRLQDEFRLTQREVASRLGKSRETVANTMRLLDLPSKIQEAIERGQLTESHGRLLLTIDDAGLQDKLFGDLIGNRITTRELKIKAHNYAQTKEDAKPREAVAPEIKFVEDKLSSELGAPVSIKDTGGSGKITIAFYSKEELINILRRLGAQEDDSLSL